MSFEQQAFDSKIQAWLQYNESAKGRLRHAVILHHLQTHISDTPMDILDVGGGTGELALDLAKRGASLTILDFSPAMLEEARRLCAGLNVTLVCAQASQIPALFEPGSFDLVLCHSILEFLDDPSALLAQLANTLRGGGLLSIVVGNRFHQVLRAVLREQDFSLAKRALDNEIPATDLFGLARRTFYPEEVRQMIQACGLRPVAEYGVRVFADLLNDEPELTPDLLALELAASGRMPFRHLARFIQFVAMKGES